MKLIKNIFYNFVSLYTNGKYQKHKERLQKTACKKYQNLSEEKKKKGEKRLEKDIKILLKKKKKKSIKSISVIRDINKSYLRMEEIII